MWKFNGHTAHTHTQRYKWEKHAHWNCNDKLSINQCVCVIYVLLYLRPVFCAILFYFFTHLLKLRQPSGRWYTFNARVWFALLNGLLIKHNGFSYYSSAPLSSSASSSSANEAVLCGVSNMKNFSTQDTPYIFLFE